MKFDWETEISLLQDPLYRETRMNELNTQSLAQKHSYIILMYGKYHKNDDITMWILQIIANIYNEMDIAFPGNRDDIREQLYKHVTYDLNNILDDEIIAERLAIMALLR